MGQFTDALARFAKKYDTNLDLVLRKVGFEMARDLIQMSPVDTGRFRANWVLSVGTPNSLVTQQTDPTGAVSMARLQGQLANVQAKSPFFITNSLPYAQALEYGWSKQAPAGMVRITAARFQGFVNVAAQGLR